MTKPKVFDERERRRRQQVSRLWLRKLGNENDEKARISSQGSNNLQTV